MIRKVTTDLPTTNAECACATIIFKQRDKIMIRFSAIGSECDYPPAAPGPPYRLLQTAGPRTHDAASVRRALRHHTRAAVSIGIGDANDRIVVRRCCARLERFEDR